MRLKDFFSGRIASVFFAACLMTAVNSASAFDVTVSDSIVSLATSGTKNYTFADTNSGANVVVALTVGVSSSDADDVITFLDGNTRLGIGNPSIGGDGNWVESGEAMTFSAALVSVSSGVLSNSVQFRIAGLGLRPYADIVWSSTAGTNALDTSSGETVYALDVTTVPLSGTNYSGQLTTTAGNFQVSDNGSYAGQSLILNATFSATNIPATVYNDTIYATLSDDGNIMSFSTNGDASVFFSGLSSPTGLAVDSAGNFYVASETAGTIQKIANGSSSLFASGLSIPAGMRCDSADNLYVASNEGGQILKFATNGSSVVAVSNAFTTIDLALNGSGNLYTANWNNHYVKKFDTNGAGVVFATNGMNLPDGVAFDAAGNLYVANFNGNSIWKFAPDGSGSLFTTNGLSGPRGMAFDSAGNLYVANVLSGTILKFNTNGVGSVFASGLAEPYFLVIRHVAVSAPGVTTHPADRSTCPGVSVSFVAAASGSPAPIVQWQVQTNGGVSFVDISGANNTTLNIAPTISYSGNQYRAVFTNSSGSATSTAATLTVNSSPANPTISFLPQNPCPNSTGNTASGPGGMSSYSWSISGGTITSGASSQTVTYTAGASGLVMIQLIVANGFGCTATNSNFTLINVPPDPMISVSPSTVTPGSTTNTATSGAIGLNLTYAWTMTNGLITSATNLSTITYTAGSNGTVGIFLTVANSAGCATNGSTNVAIILPVAPIDPHTNSWITSSAGQYVRLYTNSAAQTAGMTVSTWTFTTLNGTNVTGSQALPVYSGVQEIYSSSNFVYVRSSAMPAGPIGPLIAYTGAPLYLPTNQKSLFSIPRHPNYLSTKTTTPGGAIGYLIDGVQMYDTRDALSWTGSSEGMGNGYWTRDAYVNEGNGFDPVKGHSSPAGAYHYHSNPQGLRYLLGDHVDFNSATKTYSESTNAVTQHSPILGWVRDGYPLYGPYGYSSASNSASGIRRMLSGFVLRNGQNGTVNLSTVGRTNIPPWAQRIYGVATATGPTVAAYGPLGRYLEDSDFMGDLINPNTGSNFVKGVDYDLDEYNGRWCVTPEFPQGTYAYFVAIETNGAAKYPYYIGRAFFGNPLGGTVTNLTETVATIFVGGTNMPLVMNRPSRSSSLVTLTWSGIDGGTYKVETSTNLSTWTAVASNIAPPQATGGYTNAASETNKFYRVARTAVANYDSVGTSTNGGGGGGGSGGNGILSVSPTNQPRGTIFTLTINLDPNATPAPPPANAPINSVTVGSITGTSNNHVSQTQVTSSITIPGGAATGPQTVTLIFPGPPTNMAATITYTLTNGFTIQ